MDQINVDLGVLHNPYSRLTTQNAMRQHRYIHCWFEGACETNAMWGKYGESGKGVCIYSSKLRLWRALTTPQELSIFLHSCVYSDEGHPVPEFISFAPAFRKISRYQDEHEIRLLAERRREHIISLTPGSETADHVQLVVDLPKLIQKIIVGSRMSSKNFDTVIAEASKIMSPQLIERSIVSFDSTNT
jgi:hypothetical protein